MTLVASTIPNLVSGVSQQPAPSRLKTSGELMNNAFPTIVSGLLKRPPSELVASLDNSITINSDAAIHTIDRSVDEKYVLVCGSGDLELFDIVGTKQNITFPDGKAYLPTTSVSQKLRFVTVADTTFICNTEKVVTASAIADTRVNPGTQGTVFVKRAVASVVYAVYLNGVLIASFTTSDNTTAATAIEGTTEIATNLRTSAQSNGYTVRQYGPVIVIDIADGDTLQVTDEFGGNSMQVYTDTVQQFSDLPPRERPDRLVKIQGDAGGEDTSYWVQYQEDGGVWNEVVGYNSKREFDANTMPHILVKTGVNTFEFRQNAWIERQAGDDDSNPDPSFVNSTLNSIFLFKGRFGILSEENVIMSEVGNFEQLWRSTALQLLDSDPIDVASATGRVATLYHAESFSDELIFFSDKQQFRLSSGQVLSPESVGITSSTSFPCSTTVQPVAVGSSAYFVANGATHSLARELFIDGVREIVEGENIAVQVPTYIPNNIRQLVASNTTDTLMMLSGEASNELYVYKWYITERQKVQSAWCKWVFNESVEILGLGFLDNYLYLVTRYGGSVVHLERLLVGPFIDRELLLDHQITDADFSVFSYSVLTDKTSITLPYSHPATVQFYRTDDGTFAPYDGVIKVSDTEYTIPNDVSAHSITAGVNYEFRYRFSTQYLREASQDGESAIQDGRLQLRYFSVIYTDTSYFEAQVTTPNNTTNTYVFSGRILADPDNVSDTIPRDTGEFKFPVFSRNEDVTVDLVNNQPYRCAFGSVEWTASYRPKARRVP